MVAESFDSSRDAIRVPPDATHLGGASWPWNVETMTIEPCAISFAGAPPDPEVKDRRRAPSDRRRESESRGQRDRSPYAIQCVHPSPARVW